MVHAESMYFLNREILELDRFNDSVYKEMIPDIYIRRVIRVLRKDYMYGESKELFCKHTFQAEGFIKEYLNGYRNKKVLNKFIRHLVVKRNYKMLNVIMAMVSVIYKFRSKLEG